MGLVEPGETVVEHDGKRFFRQDVRCGTTSWIEFWEDGYIPPGREEEDKPKGRRR